MTETMEQYMSKTRGDYGSGVTRPSINQDTHFVLKGQFLKELCDNTFSGLEHEDANEHIEKVLDMLSISHPNNSQDQIMLQCFPVSSDWSCQHMIRTRPSGSITTVNFLKTKFLKNTLPPGRPQRNGGNQQISSKKRSQLNNLGREIKKVNEKVYAAQVGCKLCKGPHYTKDCSQKEEGKTLEEAYYTQFGATIIERQYLNSNIKLAGPGFYQRNNGNSSYPDRRTNLEESLTKFMAESAKRHEEHSNIIKLGIELLRCNIRNQGSFD
ncbi:hypothetical protein Tco_0934386 [Tanacetum coccineum]